MKRCINWFQCHLSAKDHDEKFNIAQPSNTIDLKKIVDSSKLKKQVNVLIDENNKMDETIRGLCKANVLLKKELNSATAIKSPYHKLFEKSQSIEQAYVNMLDRFEKLEYRYKDSQLLVNANSSALVIKVRECQELQKQCTDLKNDHSQLQLNNATLVLQVSTLEMQLQKQVAQTKKWKDDYDKYAPRLDRLEKELLAKTLEIVNLHNELKK